MSDVIDGIVYCVGLIGIGIGGLLTVDVARSRLEARRQRKFHEQMALAKARNYCRRNPRYSAAGLKEFGPAHGKRR